MRRVLCLLLTLALLTACAAADALHLSPADITLDSVAFESLDPLDETRLAELNALLGHIGVTLRCERDGDTEWTGLTLDVDGAPVGALWTGESREGVTLILPGTGTPLQVPSLAAFDRLFGLSEVCVSPLMLPDLFLADAEAAADALFTEREGIGISTDKNTIRDTNNVNYGSVVTRRKAVPGSTELLLAAAVEACPDGFLKDWLAGITVTQAEELYALCKKDGKPAKIVFRGYLTDALGAETHAELEWKLRRGEKGREDKDHLTVTFAGDGGSGSFEFRLTRKDGGQTVFDIYRWEMNGFSLVKGEKDTVRAARSADGKITGEIRLRIGGDKAKTLTLTPALSVDGDAVTGTVGWQIRAEQTVSGTLTLQVGEPGLRHPSAEGAVPLPENDFAAAAETAADTVAARLMARLALLEDQEDCLYLRRGLSEEAWNEIITAAQATLRETEGEAE